MPGIQARLFFVICLKGLLVSRMPSTAVSASLYTTVNPIVALVNASDSINKTIVQFRVLAEPGNPSPQNTNSLVSCAVDDVLLNRGAEDILLQYDYETYDRPMNWFEINKVGSDVKENMFLLLSKVDLSETLTFDQERLKLFINCTTGDMKLQGSFLILVILYKGDEIETEKLICSEPKIFHVSENVKQVSLGKICCDVREEKFISSLSTDSEEFDDSNPLENSFSNSNSSSEEPLTRGLECYLKALAQNNKDYANHFDVAFGTLSLIRMLDYEQVKELNLTFECMRGSSSVSSLDVNEALIPVTETVRICRSQVKVRNVDDLGPWIIRHRNQTLKYLEIQSYFNSEEIKKGDLLHSCLSFRDVDATNPKAYDVQVIGDRYNIVAASVDHERHVGHLRCVDLRAKRDFDLRYISSGVSKFSVKIIDTLFVPSEENNDTNSVEYRVVMTARGSPTINVTYESMELSHLTAPYYRVSLMRYRPMLGTSFVSRLENCVVVSNAEVTLLRQKTYQMKRPQIESSRMKSDGKGIECKQLSDLFKVTSKEGIVYINNVNILDKITSASLNLLVEKKIDNKKYSEKTRDKSLTQLVSNITISIHNSSQSWIKFKNTSSKNVSCSWSDNQQSCSKSNGIGTSKGHCTWLIPHLKNISEDNNTSNEFEDKSQGGIGKQMKNVVSNYETCTSSPSTCPDLVCDELEKMVRFLCPQDCTPFEVLGIGNLKHAPNAGIDTISGTRCWCDKNQHCSCENVNPAKKIILDISTACNGPHCFSNKTGTSETMVSSICGNTCRLTIVSSVAVVFFLLSGFLTVVFLLYRNGKFSFKNLLRDGNNGTSINGKPSKVARISGTLVENPQYADTEEPLLDGVGNTNILWDKIYFSSNFKFSKWEIERTSLRLESVIGEGEFGKVLRARARNVPGYPKEMVVAVKTLKDCASASEYRDLISEFNLLQQVEHANIVKLIGICSSPEGPLYVVVEYCKHGSLKSYLKKFRINWQHQEKCLIDIPVLDAQGSLANPKLASKELALNRSEEKEAAPVTSTDNTSASFINMDKNVGQIIFENYMDERHHAKEFECSAHKRHPALMSDCTMNAIKYTTHPHLKSVKKASVNETLNVATSCPTLQSHGLWYRRLSDEQVNQSISKEVIEAIFTDSQNDRELVQLSVDVLETEEPLDINKEKKQSKSDEESLEFIGERDLLSFCWQIAKGMEYLGSMRIVHRDLAARNILVAEGRIAKISDFGLSRDVYEGDAYLKTSKGPLPVKWMAPESLFDHMFTPKSDVWSYGVVMWEIVTMGANPYPGITAENLFTLLKSGYRMEKPVSCSSEIFNVMQSCWQNDPKKRPHFKSLVKQFEKFLSKKSHYLDLSRMLKDNNLQFASPGDRTFE